MAVKKFIFQFHRAPGDTLMLTGLVRDLKLTYGDTYLVDVRAPYPNIWENNPHLHKGPFAGTTQTIVFDKGKQAADRVAVRLSQKGSKKHYCTAFHRAFTERTGIQLDPLFSKPDVHLTDDEKAKPRISGRYWIVIPGGKLDLTCKIWSQRRFQEVVNQLRPWGLSFVQEGATKPKHIHKPIGGVLNLIGSTSIRELMINMYHAEGVICGVTLPMHLAAALEKPCVVLAGGREEPEHEAYVNTFPGSFGPKAEPLRVPHRFLHTIGQLPCCMNKGCWLRRVKPMREYSQFNQSLCRMPNDSDPLQIIPECMQRIETNHVARAIMAYYEDGTLPPLPRWNEAVQKQFGYE